MSTLRTARERARSEVTGAILAKARQHLAEHGAAGLSLRAVARDLELVPSAVYRYFDSRDALLTALIIDAYDALGGSVEASALGTIGQSPRHRWVEAAKAARSWAVAHPHEYALLYGSPVPGYAAPEDTVAPGTRVPLALVGIVRQAAADGLLAESGESPKPARLSAATRHGAARLAATIAPELGVATVFATLLAWTQLFGLLSFELFGQTKGVVDDHEALFADAATAMAAMVGLGGTTRAVGQKPDGGRRAR